MRSSGVTFHILNGASDFFLPHKPAHGGNVAPPGLADSAPLPAHLQTLGTLSAEGSSETTQRKMYVWVPDHEGVQWGSGRASVFLLLQFPFLRTEKC